MLKSFGPEKGAALLIAIRPILDDLDKIKIDWQEHNLISATEKAIKDLKNLYPWLDDEASETLGWAFSFGFK